MRPGRVNLTMVRARKKQAIVAAAMALLILSSLSSATTASNSSGPIRDLFTRRVDVGWQAAERGGRYAYSPAPAGFDITSGAGRIRLDRPGMRRSAQLLNAGMRDVDLRFRFSVNERPNGAEAVVAAVLRADKRGNGYRVGVTIGSSRTSTLSLSRVRRQSGSILQSTTLVLGKQSAPDGHTATKWQWMRVRIAGTNPARLQVKLWSVGQRQPTAWQLDVVDDSPGATTSGITLGAQISPTSREATTVLFDDLNAHRVTAAPGTPTPLPASPTPPPASPPPSGSRAFPPASTLRHVSTPRVLMPGYLDSIVDPTWNTSVTRISNVPGVRNTYSRRQAWNKDGTLLLLGIGGTAPRMLVDGSTYAILNPSVAGDGLWSETDPNVLIRASSSTGDVFTFDPMTNRRVATVINLSQFNFGSQLQIMAQSSLDDAGRYLLLSGVTAAGQHTVITVDMLSKEFSTFDMATKPHAGSISHGGRYVALNWNESGSGPEHGIWLFDVNLTPLRQIAPMKSHSDFAYDSKGNEVLVYIAPKTGAVMMDQLSNGTVTVVLQGGTAMLRGHLSGRNNDRPGWVYCSVYDSTNTSARAGNDQVFALKLDGSQTVEIFAHAHHGLDIYVNDPMATVSRDGTNVLFGSEWAGPAAFAYVAQWAP